MARFFRRQADERQQRDELLSAYLDGELDPRERERLEARLATDPALRAELKALRRTVSLVHDLPRVPAPRNFILPQTAAERARPVPSARPRRAWVAPLLTAATAVVSFLFVVVLAGDMLLPGMGKVAYAPGAAELEEVPQVALEAEPQEEAEDERAAAMPGSPVAEPSPEASRKDNAEGEPYDEKVAEEGTPVPAMESGGPTEEPAAPASTAAVTVTGEAAALTSTDRLTQTGERAWLASTITPTAAEEAAVIPTAPAEATLAPREDVGVVEPTPEKVVEAAPTMTRGLLEREPLELPSILFWRALEITLGLAALVLTLLTIRAWRGRRR